MLKHIIFFQPPATEKADIIKCGFCGQGDEIVPECGALHCEVVAGRRVAAHHKCMVRPNKQCVLMLPCWVKFPEYSDILALYLIETSFNLFANRADPDKASESSLFVRVPI